jgi:putative redox protein
VESFTPRPALTGMEIEVSFPGGKRVDAQVGAFLLETDQPPELGGEGAAPAPFDLFLASLATCAGIYVLGYCQARGLPAEGLKLVQRTEDDPVTHRPRRITIDVRVPPGFPPAAHAAIARAAAACKVKKVLGDPPAFDVVVSSDAGDERGAACAGA